ncbi:hypothetical protein [Streptomyces sp. CMB-StM0423]|nr:hypothetical protein [Streptomyces sp. CMB-StM0423]
MCRTTSAGTAPRRSSMADVVFVAVTVAFFSLLVLVVKGAERR